MTCTCDIWEECHERSDGASTMGTHESRSIEKSERREWQWYEKQEMGWKQQFGITTGGGSVYGSYSAGVVRRLDVWSFSGCCEIVGSESAGKLCYWRCKSSAEIVCRLVVTCSSSWGWRSFVRTWSARSLSDFGAVSRRSIGESTRKIVVKDR